MKSHSKQDHNIKIVQHFNHDDMEQLELMPETLSEEFHAEEGDPKDCNIVPFRQRGFMH